jgi:hypothetical protein
MFVASGFASNGVSARIGGVAPNWIEGLYRDRAVDLWMPLQEGAVQRVERSSRNFWVVGRLRRDVSSSQSQMAIRQSRNGSAEMSVLPYNGLTPEMAEGNSRVGTLLGFAAGAMFFIARATTGRTNHDGASQTYGIARKLDINGRASFNSVRCCAERRMGSALKGGL